MHFDAKSQSLDATGNAAWHPSGVVIVAREPFLVLMQRCSLDGDRPLTKLHSVEQLYATNVSDRDTLSQAAERQSYPFEIELPGGSWSAALLVAKM